MSEKEYWDQFYASCDWIPKEPSSFATWCQPLLAPSNTLLEFGCGSGRDALYFVEKGLKQVIAIDISSSTIDKLQSIEQFKNLSFLIADFTKLPPKKELNLDTLEVVYSRFTLHAIRKVEASSGLRWAFENLSEGGILCVEARSTKGELYGKGTPVIGEKDAFIFGHYRRFINSGELVEELSNLGFMIEKLVEESGLAIFRDDDPVVIRVIAKKPHAK